MSTIPIPDAVREGRVSKKTRLVQYMKYQLDIKRCAPYITESLSDGLEMSRLLLDRIGKGGVARVPDAVREGRVRSA